VRQEFERRLAIPRSTAQAWPTLTDVRQVAGWIPKLQEVQELSPLERYSAVLEDRLGPFRLRADLEIEVIRVEVPDLIEVRAAGEDRQVHSRISVEAQLHLFPADAGAELEVKGAYEVTGRVAALGSGTIRKKGEVMLDEFIEHAREALS